MKLEYFNGDKIVTVNVANTIESWRLVPACLAEEDDETRAQIVIADLLNTLGGEAGHVAVEDVRDMLRTLYPLCEAADPEPLDKTELDDAINRAGEKSGKIREHVTAVQTLLTELSKAQTDKERRAVAAKVDAAVELIDDFCVDDLTTAIDDIADHAGNL